MRIRVLLFILLLSCLPVLAQGNRVITATDSFSSPGSTVGADISSRGVRYNILTWAIKGGTVSGCSIKLSVAATQTGTRSDLITGQTCTSNGTSSIVSGTPSWYFVELTSWTVATGTPTITWIYGGYQDQIGGGAGAAPADGTYIVETSNSTLSSEFALASLATGILRNTTTTGIPQIAVAGDFPTLNQNTSGTAASLSAVLGPALGGTGIVNNAAMTVTGSGNFAFTRTLTGTTNVTFPTTGTLATLAGTEAFSNKTISASTNVIGGVTVTLGTDAVGDLLFRGTSGILSHITDVATGQAIMSGGVGVAPAYSGAPSFTTSVTAPAVVGSTSVSGGTGSFTSITGSSLALTGAPAQLVIKESGSGTTDIRLRSNADADQWRIGYGISIGGTNLEFYNTQTSTLALKVGTSGAIVAAAGLTATTLTGSTSVSGGSGSFTTGTFTGAVSTTVANQGYAQTHTTSAVYSGATNTGGSVYFGIDSSTGGTFGFGNYSAVLEANVGSNPFKLVTNGAVAMSITSAQAVTLSSGITSSGATQTYTMCMSSSYEIIRDTLAACIASSERYKTNIQPLERGLSTVLALEPIQFHFTDEFNGNLRNDRNYNTEQVGFRAEQVEGVDSRLVTWEGENGSGPVHSVRYANITASLVKGEQELYAEIIALKAEVKALREEKQDKFKLGVPNSSSIYSSDATPAPFTTMRRVIQ